ncbi:hypothetical protein [Neoroseomonas marina]|uniref:hypothetical protein n=1 Tax=Neoroseomonas marina TaxID=1232220 RepID=UPI0014731BB4|nr:hypothetical protein [Neoroseomonas marina]
MAVSGARKVKSLKVENARLKELPAESMFDVSMLREMLPRMSDVRLTRKGRYLGDRGD